MARVLTTGTAGFIGFRLASLLLDEGLSYTVMTDYYDAKLKQRSRQMLLKSKKFSKAEVSERMVMQVILQDIPVKGVRALVLGFDIQGRLSGPV